MKLFRSDGDYTAFLRCLNYTLRLLPMRILFAVHGACDLQSRTTSAETGQWDGDVGRTSTMLGLGGSFIFGPM